eukprot:SAG31_NODE_493_length_14893_cov_20.429701_1_plen_144_part_00
MSPTGEGNQSAASQTKLESHDSSDKTIDAGLPEKSESKNELAAGELAAGNSGGATADGNGQVNDIPAVGDIVSVTFATDTAEGGLVTSVDVGPLKRGFTVQWPGESRTWHIDPDLHAVCQLSCHKKYLSIVAHVFHWIVFMFT